MKWQIYEGRSYENANFAKSIYGADIDQLRLSAEDGENAVRKKRYLAADRRSAADR
jgi:hypothetical protein